MAFSLIIADSQAGQRLDKVVSAAQGCSRSCAAQMISQGLIQVNQRIKKPSARVKQGDCIIGAAQTATPDPFPRPEPMDLSILHEDAHILVVDKPAGIVVHPAPGHMTGTLVNGLLAHDETFGQAGWDPLRPGIVHRLDKDTSGLIVVAKSLASLAFLQKEFKQRRVEKHYLALALGKSIPASGTIEMPISRHPVKRKLMAVDHEAGKYAKTGFTVVERFEEAALVDVRLHTGRTHQIRVHFYAGEMPLMGDTVYQYRRFRNRPGIAPRQMLHSWKLGLRHPYSGQRLAFEAPLPEDFLKALDCLRAEQE